MDQASSSPAALIWIRRSPASIAYRSRVLGAVSNLVSEPAVMCNYTYHQRIYTHSLNLSSPCTCTAIFLLFQYWMVSASTCPWR